MLVSIEYYLAPFTGMGRLHLRQLAPQGKETLITDFHTKHGPRLVNPAKKVPGGEISYTDLILCVKK